MMKRLFLPILFAASLLLIHSCKKDPLLNERPATTGTARISFTNMFADSLLELNTENYITVNADTFSCSLFKYYISNIVLTDVNGKNWYESESYHLLDQSELNSLHFTLNGIPEGEYNSIRFMIGVDSARNVSGSQTGALDPAHGMFWTWNSGYIFAKLEGNSPQSILPGNAIVYHIGGYSGMYAAQRMIQISFGNNPAQISETTTPEIRIKTDLANWFGPNILSISETPSVNDFNSISAGIADNYANLFSLIEVRN